MTTGEGGMISSNDEKLVDLARSISWWGRDCYCVGAQNLLSNGTCGNRFSNWLEGQDIIIDHKYLFAHMGYNLKPLDLQGAIGLEQLEKFDTIHKRRRVAKNTLSKLIKSKVPGVHIPAELPRAETSWFGTPIVCTSHEQKTKLVKHFESNKIQTRNYFAGNILMHPAYKDLDDYKNYPHSNKVLDLVFFIGAAPHYDEQVFDYVEKVLGDF
jgi:CDP-6-deoxy-D-xylo-4-hexulose-3-dehydrase